jgi:O-methyltransferase
MATHTEAGLLNLTAERAHEAWYLSRRPPHLSRHRIALHEFAVGHIGSMADLRYLEFGVHQGGAIRRLASWFRNPDARFVGFDSFLGLPESWSNLPAGHFSTGGKPPAFDDPRVSFEPGWFQNSARVFLPRLGQMPPKITLVHFDADLYSSTLFLLTSLWWYLPEYFFIFDEFMGQELAALRHFVTAFPVEVEFYSRVDNPRERPVQVFGRLRVTEMVVTP